MVDDRLKIDAVEGKTPELTRDIEDPRYQEHLLQRILPVLDGVEDQAEALSIIKSHLRHDIYAKAGIPVQIQAIPKYSDEEAARQWAEENPFSAAVHQNAHAFSKGVISAITVGPYAASRVLESVGVPREYLINHIPDPAEVGADIRQAGRSIFELPSTLMDPGKLERTVREYKPGFSSPEKWRDVEDFRAFNRGVQGSFHDKGLLGQSVTLPGDFASALIPLGAVGKFSRGAGLLEQGLNRANVMAAVDLAKQEQGDEPDISLEESGRRAIGSWLGGGTSIAGSAAAQLPGAGAFQRTMSSALADFSAGGLVGALTAQPIGDTLTGNFSPDYLQQSLYAGGMNLVGTALDVPNIRAAARGDANALARIESYEADKQAKLARLRTIHEKEALRQQGLRAQALQKGSEAAVLGVTESPEGPKVGRAPRYRVNADAAMGLPTEEVYRKGYESAVLGATESTEGPAVGRVPRFSVDADRALGIPQQEVAPETSAADIYGPTGKMGPRPTSGKESSRSENVGLRNDLNGLADEDLTAISSDDGAIASIAKEAKLSPKSVKIMVKREQERRVKTGFPKAEPKPAVVDDDPFAPDPPKAEVAQPDPVRQLVEDPAPEPASEVAQPPVEEAAAQPEVYHAGELTGTGPMIHAGSKSAAEFVQKSAGGKLFKSTNLPKNPVEMLDSGRAHDAGRVAEDISTANPGNEKLGLLAQYVKKLMADGDQAKAEQALVSGLKKFGFDGIKYRNVNEAPGSESYVLFDSAKDFAPVEAPAPPPDPVVEAAPKAKRPKEYVGWDIERDLRDILLEIKDHERRIAINERQLADEDYIHHDNRMYETKRNLRMATEGLEKYKRKAIEFIRDHNLDADDVAYIQRSADSWVPNPRLVKFAMGGDAEDAPRATKKGRKKAPTPPPEPVAEAPAPAQPARPGPWTEPVLSKTGKIHPRSDAIVGMINMPDEQFRAITGISDLPENLRSAYRPGSLGNKQFLSDLSIALRRRTGESIETGTQGDTNAPDFVIGGKGARPMLQEPVDPAQAVETKEAWEKRTGRKAPDEMFSGIPVPKEVRDAIDAAVFQGIEMAKAGAKDVALKAKGFVDNEIAILRELARGDNVNLPDLRNQMMVRYHGSGVYEEEPGRLSRIEPIKKFVPSKSTMRDFSTSQLRMLKKGLTDPAGALEESFALTERMRTRMAKTLNPEARKWFSVGPRNDALRQMLIDHDESVRAGNADLVDAGLAMVNISPEDSHALWLAGETGEGALKPEHQRIIEIKNAVVDDLGRELMALGKLSQETWNEFHRPGSRYQRRYMSKEGLIAKGMERKASSQLRRQYDPYGEEALDSIASGPEGVINSMLKRRKYRTVEDAKQHGFITDHRATVQTIREAQAALATLKLMRGIKEKFPELWTTSPKGPRGVPKKPPQGSSWVLADGAGWGALEGEWVHKDAAGSLLHLVKPRETGFYGFLKWVNSRLGQGLVMGSLGTIVKSTGAEGVMINMRNGVGLAQQAKLWKDFIRSYRAYAKTGKVDDTIRKLMQNGEWEVEARDYRNTIDEGLDPALRPEFRDVKSTGILTYPKEFWNQYKAVLETYLTDVEQSGGGFWDRARARGEATAQAGFGFKLFNALGLKADKISGQGMIDLARFLDQGHRYVLLKALTSDPGTTLPHQLYKMATGTKFRAVSDDLAIKLVKENFDMRENPAWVNALADHPFGIRFLRPRYKALHNAVIRGGALRNPFGYAVAGNLAYIAKAAFLATNDDADLEEMNKQQMIAADAYNIPAYDLAPIYRDSNGGYVFADTSFFSVTGLVPEVITGSEGMARSGNMFTNFARGVASQSPMLQSGMSLLGYDVYRNSAGNAPDVSAPVKMLTPTAGIMAAINRMRVNSRYEKDHMEPRFSTMDQASRFFTGMATIYTGAPGSALNRQLRAKAKDNAARREHGTHQITVTNEAQGKRKSRKRRRR